jgi:3-oxoacyl-[acyl-carrier-protein] synthase II
MATVTAAGLGTDAFWPSVLAPAPAGHRPIADWDPSPWLGAVEVRHADRVTQFAVAAAELAVEMAKPTSVDEDTAAVVVGTALAGVSTMEQQTLLRAERGDRRVSPFVVPMIMPNAAAAAMSHRLRWHGPCETITTACAAGTHAIGAAARLIAGGVSDVVVTGGSEAAMTGTMLAGFRNMRALSATGLLRPFDTDRDGFVVGEGAAMLVLEAWPVAVARGARILGEVLGAASTSDSYDVTMPRPDGADAARCMRLALRDAGLPPRRIGQVNAHGTGTRQGDQAEARALRAVFGDDGPPVTATKGATGHLFGASSAVEAVAALLSMAHRIIPPVHGLSTVDPDIDLDLVADRPRSWQAGPVLSNSFGFGGHNGCLILGPGQEA